MRSLWTSFRHPNGSKTRNKALSGSNGTLAFIDRIAAGVREEALAAANKERTPDWRATPDSQGNLIRPA
jgi:hypothetical protein